MTRFLLAFASVWMLDAVGCTCVWIATPTEPLQSSDIVFLGSVLQSKRLPEHSKMRGRQRYAVTFQPTRTWKGEAEATVTLYALDPGTDCIGAEYEVGKQYLVFASREKSKDVEPDPDFFWFGWTDVLPEGTPMLVPRTACMPGGEASRSEVRKQLRRLGPGRDIKTRPHRTSSNSVTLH